MTTQRMFDKRTVCLGGFAGGMITVGCMVYLACESKLLGAFLFSAGLFLCCATRACSLRACAA